MYRIVWATVESPRRLRRTFRAPAHRRWDRLAGVPRAVSIWQDAGGNWHSGAPTVEETETAQVVYHGGRDYDLSLTEAMVLRDAGFDTTIPPIGFEALVGVGF